MGKSSSQVVGYRYYAKFAAFIGNRIEKLIGVNFDSRGWIVKDKDDTSPYLEIIKPSLYGENEGGVAGIIDIEVGTSDQEPNKTYQKYFPLVSGYPYQSYLVFRGNTIDSSFYLGNSGYMKEMLLWVKRTRVKNDGDSQWYEMRGDGAIVCEIDGNLVDNREVIPVYEQSAVLSNSAHAELYTDGNLSIIDNESLQVLYNTPSFSFPVTISLTVSQPSPCGEGVRVKYGQSCIVFEVKSSFNEIYCLASSTVILSISKNLSSQ